MSSIYKSNFSTTCRVCLEKSSKLYPLEGDILNVDVHISTMITYCTSVQIVVDENLPNGVCIPCFKIVRIAYNFIKEFKETNSRLLAEGEIYSNQIEVKEEPYEQILLDEDSAIDIVEVDGLSEHAYATKFVSPQENIVGYANEDDDKSDSELLTEIPLQNVEEIVENSEETVLEVKGKSFKKQNIFLQKHECPVCLDIFFHDFKKGLARHLQRNHSDSVFKCNKCSLEAELTLDLYIQHYTKNHLYHCNVCNRQYKNKSNFHYHLKGHIDGTLQCPYQNCKKSFHSQLSMRKHIEVHSNIPKYICSKCGKKFITYDTFRYHIKTHDGTRSHLCSVCGRAFLQAVHLKYHMWHHTGVKQFNCTDCEKSYTSVTQLKKHRRKYCGSGRTNEKSNQK